MAVTVAPTCASARTNCRWLAGNRGSMETTCMSAASPVEPGVELLVLSHLLVPRIALRHAVLHELSPEVGLVPGAERELPRVAQGVGGIALEQEPGRGVDGVGQPAGLAHDRHR